MLNAWAVIEVENAFMAATVPAAFVLMVVDTSLVIAENWVGSMKKGGEEVLISHVPGYPLYQGQNPESLVTAPCLRCYQLLRTYLSFKVPSFHFSR